MKKRSLALILVLALLLSTTALAVENRSSIARINLSFSGTTANCSGSVSSANDRISATLELLQDGVHRASWGKAGTSAVSISGSIQVDRGHTYTLMLYGTIDGEPFSAEPVVKTLS